MTLKSQKNIINDESGQFAVIVALSLFPLFAAIGAAIDYTQANNADEKLQYALDTAVLAAAIAKQDSISDSNAKSKAEKVFEANNAAKASISDFDIVFDDDSSKITATVSAEMQTSFMAILGYNEIPITNTASANYGNNSELPVDLGIMLDVSGSMNYDGKLNGLKSAVTGLMEEIIGEGNTSETVRVAFAPFSSSVNAGIYADGLISGSSSNNCIGERGGRNAYNDEAPRNDMFDVDGEFAISKDENDGVYRDAHFRGYPVSGLDELDVSTICPDSEIQPLTGDYDELLRTLDGYSAAGITAGHLGVAWTWYLVSEKWRSFWPSAHKPALDSERQKAVILMSDGEFNTYFQSGNGLPDEQTAELCENMKSENITVFSVSFGDTGSSEDFLRVCASQPDYFYSADSSSELGAAFLSIASKLQKNNYPTLTN